MKKRHDETKQEYKENNDRVQKLIEILKPIVGTLIRERSEKGTQFRNEEREYWRAKEIEEATKREKAEQEAYRAEEARQEAEKKYQKAENSRKQYEEEVNVRKQQSYFLESALTIDRRTSFYNTHVIKCNAEDIAINVKDILDKYPQLKGELELQSIAYATNKIIMTARNFSIINYDFERSIENEDIGVFVEQYFKSEIANDTIKIEINNTSKSYIRFPYQDVTMMLYNIISNSKKARATKLKIEIFNNAKNIIFRFIDNGEGIKDGIELNNLFDLGLSYTHGTGIGLAQIKDLIENKLNGKAVIERNEIKGITLEVIIPNENKI
jgi:signal transduction histidine kinase